MNMSSPSLHYGQKGPKGVEGALKLQDLPGWRPVTPCSLDSGFKRPPCRSADGPERKSTFTVSVVVSSQQRGKYSASFQGQSLSAEKSESDPHKSCQPFFFPKYFVTFASNKIT